MESWGYRMTKTFFLVYIWLCMGLYIAIYGPALIDLKMLFNTSYGRLSTAIAARGIGIPVAAIISGVVADKFPDWLDLMVALAATLVAIVTAAVPYVNTTDTLWFLSFCIGYGLGCTNIGGQRLIITMWRDKAAPPTHAMHGGYGIGALLIPLMINPLLAVTDTTTASQNSSNIALANHSIANYAVGILTNQSNTLPTNHYSPHIHVEVLPNHTLDFESEITMPIVSQKEPSHAPNDANTYLGNDAMATSFGNLTKLQPNQTAASGITIVKETRIQIAYTAVAIVTFAGALPFFIFQFKKCKQQMYHGKLNSRYDKNNIVKPRTFREIINPSTYTDGHLCYGIGMFILLVVFYGNVVGGEQMFGLFVRSFSIDSLGFSKDEASYLNTVYWLGFTVARMLFTGLAHFIRIKYLISIEVTLLLTSVTVLDVLGAKTSLILWIFTALQGLLFAPLFPSGISYVNTMMDVSGVCMTIIILASGVGGFLYNSLVGTFYDKIGPRAVLYAMQASGALIFVVVVLMRTISYRRKSR